MIEIAPNIHPLKDICLLPLFADNFDVTSRIPLRGLSVAQKRAVRSVLKHGIVPKSGVFPVYSGDAMVLVHLLEKNDGVFVSRDAREAGESIADSASRYNLERISVLPGALKHDLWTAFREGAVLGIYRFEKIQGKNSCLRRNNKRSRGNNKKHQKNNLYDRKEVYLQTIHFFGKQNRAEIERLETLFEGVKLAKDLVNTPPMTATPSYVENIARDLAKKSRKISIKVLGEKDLKKLGCGGILGVGQASSENPRLIVLEYRGVGKESPIVLVGKGVTYDSGGLCLKVGTLRSMKQDLAGAATVLGSLFSIVKRNLKKNVIAVLPVVENLLGEKSYKVDDVLTMYNGKTVEITNTDAEGRLILADALAYAEDIFKPRALVDIATLTGCAFKALGEDITAAMGNDGALMNTLRLAALSVDEPLWELPLHKRYAKNLESKVADIVNHSKKIKAETIEGGLFLQHFVGKDTPWCHLDIGACAFDEGKELATGRNVRLLVDFLTHYLPSEKPPHDCNFQNSAANGSDRI